ncbi:MAG: hypothetical protein RBS77_00655 [Candidatus Moranbacteria bacterium]|jgi:hypothetical protein|nr:hypothetical protein [Candidatus Moranbacteria bacterium]
MKKMVPFLLAVVFFCGLSTDVFAQEDLGLGRKAKAQMETVHRDRVSNVLLEDNQEHNVLLFNKHEEKTSGIRISPVKCLHKVVMDEQFVHVYDQNGDVSLMSVSAQELSIRVPCPKE